ncbi:MULTISPECIES: hypothetical protein [unclassified Rhodococcus (in: high G+C Gram-positive bacteria)]|uniref:hypothetical protein n=1 Tax=unclassified Rhodococcus (in: high G+C Gram-positive bacteria) TaxID=192944 RepID=UPI003393E8BF
MSTTTIETTPPVDATADETAPVDTEVTLVSPEAPETQDADAPAGKGGNAESAKWRTKLREAEAERDSLSATLDSLRRAEVTRVASAVLAQGTDLFDFGGYDIADVLTEDGAVDAARVTELSKELQLARPGLSRHGIGATHHQFGQAATGPATGRGGSRATWGGVLRGR